MPREICTTYQFEQGPAVFLFAGRAGSSICQIPNTIQKHIHKKEAIGLERRAPNTLYTVHVRTHTHTKIVQTGGMLWRATDASKNIKKNKYEIICFSTEPNASQDIPERVGVVYGGR